MRTTTNLGLKVWDLGVDEWTAADLEFNWDAIDADSVTGRPANRVEKLSGDLALAVLPTLTNTAPDIGRLIYLDIAATGYDTHTIVRWSGTAWRNIGQAAIQASLPTVGNYQGRLVALTAAVGGFAINDLVINTDGANTWKKVGGIASGAALPGSPTSGDLFTLTSAAGGFPAFSVVLYTGSAWVLIGPQPVPPGTEKAYATINTDITTTNAANPGDTILTFGAATFENVKHYLEVSIPWIDHTVTNAIVRFQLQETTTLVGTTKDFSLPSNIGSGANLRFLIPFTPTAAAHTYNVKWMVVTAGTASIKGSTRGEAIFRIWKA